MPIQAFRASQILLGRRIRIRKPDENRVAVKGRIMDLIDIKKQARKEASARRKQAFAADDGLLP